MAQPLLIADGPWLLYRSFFALPQSIADSEGRPVNALLGTVNALLAALQARPARAVCVCMGAEQARYRVDLYPPYHAHRDPMPGALARQWKLLPRIVQALGWHEHDSPDLEADDVMHSLVQAELEAGGEALLITGDRDLFQDVGERVAILELRSRGEPPLELGPAQVLQRYGIPPQLVPDFIALRGDPSDGLPGAPGIGAKTAAELLRRYGPLEQVLTEAVRPSSRERPRVVGALRDNARQLLDFKRIATLVRIDLDRPPDAAGHFAGGAVVARELGMSRLAARLDELARA